MIRTDNLPMFAPADWPRVLNMLDPVAPAPLKAHQAAEWKARRLRRAACRLWCQREDRRVGMIERAKIPKTGTGAVSDPETGDSRAGRSPGNNDSPAQEG